MTTERRRYYRIEDRALIKYRAIADDALNDERRFIFLNEIRASNLHAALMGIDLRLQELIDVVRSQSKPMSEAIELINRKFTLLERVVALENTHIGTQDYREHEPVGVSLSGGGIALEASEPLEVNVNLAIDLVLLPSHHPMRSIGRVVECHETENGRFAISIEFEQMRDEDRDVLIQHIVRKQSQMLRSERATPREDAA
jgi:c-di-GMP-binding flagellar brake protein YcgR